MVYISRIIMIPETSAVNQRCQINIIIRCTGGRGREVFERYVGGIQLEVEEEMLLAVLLRT